MSTVTRFLILVAFATVCGFSQISAGTDKLVCYYQSWSINRHGNGQFTPDDIDVNLCTHLIYSFVGIDDDGNVVLLSERVDINMKPIEKFVQLKKRNSKLKTMVAIGGWNQGSVKYSKMAATSSTRANFINSIIDFLNMYGFDGIDIDWEYPAQRGGASTDKANFVALVREMRERFNGLAGKRFVLTAAVGASAKTADTSYDIANLAKNLDWVHLMTYTFQSSNSGHTGHNSPLYGSSNDNTPQKNLAASVSTWLSGGASPDKLVIGVGAYGRTFTLKTSSNHRLGAPTTGPGNKGPLTAQTGILGYNEICQLLGNQTWKTVWDDQQKVPYSYEGNQWVSYDNEESVKLKASYAKSMKLGGVMVWSMTTDDFRGTCGLKYPLINSIKQELASTEIIDFAVQPAITKSPINGSGGVY